MITGIEYKNIEDGKTQVIAHIQIGLGELKPEKRTTEHGEVITMGFGTGAVMQIVEATIKNMPQDRIKDQLEEYAKAYLLHHFCGVWATPIIKKEDGTIEGFQEDYPIWKTE